MAHGDDSGLRLPPRLAPVQAVVLVARADAGVAEQAAAIAAGLAAAGVRVEVDDRVDSSFGRRVVDWEIKGVPVRLEVGPRDLARGEVVLARRLRATKDPVAMGAVVPAVIDALDETQAAMLEEATALRTGRTRGARSIDEAIEASAEGFASLPLSALGPDGEDRANAAGVSVRCIVGADGGPPGGQDGDESLVAIVGRAY